MAVLEARKESVVPFERFKDVLNKAYYSSRGAKYGEDFVTVAPAMGRAWADRVYHRDLKNLPEGAEHVVLELGVGNGEQAAAFFKRLKELDEEHGTRHHEKVRYVLGDFSAKMLEDAMRKVSEKHPENVGQFDTVELDVNSPGWSEKLRGKGPFHNVFFNELWDDLTTHIVRKKPDGSVEALFVAPSEVLKKRLGKGPMISAEDLFALVREGKTDELARLLRFFDYTSVEPVFGELKEGLRRELSELFGDLGGLEEGTHILNTGAARMLLELFEHLAEGGSLATMDYGRGDSFTHEAFRGVLAPEDYGLFRFYGGQPTTDVWFHFLEDLAKKKGFKVSVFPHKVFYSEPVLPESPFVLDRSQLESVLRKQGFSEEELALFPGDFHEVRTWGDFFDKMKVFFHEVCSSRACLSEKETSELEGELRALGSLRSVGEFLEKKSALKKRYPALEKMIDVWPSVFPAVSFTSSSLFLRPLAHIAFNGQPVLARYGEEFFKRRGVSVPMSRIQDVVFSRSLKDFEKNARRAFVDSFPSEGDEAGVFFDSLLGSLKAHRGKSEALEEFRSSLGSAEDVEKKVRVFDAFYSFLENLRGVLAEASPTGFVFEAKKKPGQGLTRRV